MVTGGVYKVLHRKGTFVSKLRLTPSNPSATVRVELRAHISFKGLCTPTDRMQDTGANSEWRTEATNTEIRKVSSLGMVNSYLLRQEGLILIDSYFGPC